MITLGDLDAKTRADRVHKIRSREAKLYEAGRCIRCGGKRETDAQRCLQCKAKAAEQKRWREPPLKAPKVNGPKPKPRWNFGTDAAIVERIKLAKDLAWRIAVRAGLTRDIDDLIGDALLGLVVAGRTFDESYRVPFGAWATTRIRGAVWDGIRRRTERHAG